MRVYIGACLKHARMLVAADVGRRISGRIVFDKELGN